MVCKIQHLRPKVQIMPKINGHLDLNLRQWTDLVQQVRIKVDLRGIRDGQGKWLIWMMVIPQILVPLVIPHLGEKIKVLKRIRIHNQKKFQMVNNV